MSKPAPKPLRCAIYTRVSTDSGLEQDFNSLDAQREASEAYIKSQSHEGWELVRTGYDDGGFSGGSLERPALQKLLVDIKAKAIDVVVVYKVDRLTRSLADFAKLVELFDAHSVSFVSVTQSFNTTTSMGRLTLNVLLSFAQFEREVTSERIRDKIAASKKKGLWVGGTVPLGYQVVDRKLIINKAEAKTVRMIFERYLALGSLLRLLEELNTDSVRSRRRKLSNGRTVGGVRFTRGPLCHLLKNRTYIGEINHRDQSYPGEHEAIVDRKVFEAVQALLAANLQAFNETRAASDALLMGKLYDDAGNLMTPTHTLKKGLRYRYYISRALVEGRKAEAGALARVSAPSIETAVVEATRTALKTDLEVDSPYGRATLRSSLDRVDIRKGALRVSLVQEDGTPKALTLPWSPPKARPRREILNTQATVEERPIRSETRQVLLRGLAQGRQWLDELVSGKVTDTDVIATREGRSKRSVHMMISLAFLGPDIVEAATTGCLPRGVGLTRLTDMSPSWFLQRDALGLGTSKSLQ